MYQYTTPSSLKIKKCSLITKWIFLKKITEKENKIYVNLGMDFLNYL